MNEVWPLSYPPLHIGQAVGPGIRRICASWKSEKNSQKNPAPKVGVSSPIIWLLLIGVVAMVAYTAVVWTVRSSVNYKR